MCVGDIDIDIDIDFDFDFDFDVDFDFGFEFDFGFFVGEDTGSVEGSRVRRSVERDTLNEGDSVHGHKGIAERYCSNVVVSEGFDVGSADGGDVGANYSIHVFLFNSSILRRCRRLALKSDDEGGVTNISTVSRPNIETF